MESIATYMEEFSWLPKLGTGANGSAYDCGDCVLKVTSSESEFEAAKFLIKNPMPFSVKIYEVAEIDGEFFILKEKVAVVEITAKDEDGEFYGDQIVSLSGVNHTPYQLCQGWKDFRGNEYRELSEKEINSVAKAQRGAFAAKCYKWFYSAFKAAEKNGFDTSDLYKNIGVSNGSSAFVFFDLMIETA